jgi:hypothetical protein
MNMVNGAMIRTMIREIQRTSGFFNRPNMAMAMRLSTPVLTKAVANIRLPMMNQVASDQYIAGMLLRSTMPVIRAITPMLKATMGSGMASVMKHNTTNSTMPTAA